MIKDASVGPFYVATYSGFLVIENVEGGRTRLYTTADVRNASTFPSFAAADSAAKWGVNKMFPPDVAYFAIFCLPSFIQEPTMTEAQIAELRERLEASLLDEDEANDPEPWGEDGAIDSFERGQKHGAHDLAVELLEILDGETS